MNDRTDLSESSGSSFFDSCAGTTPKERHNQVRAAVAFCLWSLSYAVSLVVTKKGLVPPGVLAWFVAVLPTLIAVWVVLAYMRWIREADELQRLVQLQILAFSLSVSLFAFGGYRLLEILGAPPADFDMYLVFTCLLYCAVTVLAWRRYR